MTLLVRDEADILEHWLRYHLARGIDVVIATDHRSADGTTDILRSYQRDGRVVLLREHGEVMQQAEWVTRMARLAATEHGADWVIASDADEFWWPRSASFAELLEDVPSRFGVVRGLMRQFVFCPGEGSVFERMTIRARPSADLTSPYHAQVKVVHRGVPDASVTVGNHDVEGRGLRLIRDWFPFEVLHFPIRNERQLVDKFRRRATSPDGQHIVKALDRLARGEQELLLAETAFNAAALEAGLRAGSLVRDVRLRNALRSIATTGSLRSPTPPNLLDDADLAEDATVALQFDGAAVLARRCAELEHRAAVLEHRGSVRGRLAGRLSRRLSRP